MIARALPCVLVTALLAGAPSVSWAADDDDEEVDTREMGKTVKELWAQFEILFLDKQWMKACARLDKLREMGDALGGNKKKAGYAYARCAATYLKQGKLNECDHSLELSELVVGKIPEQKPVEAQLHRALARIALEKKDLPQALAHYEIAAARSPESKEELDASLRLTRYAQQAFDDGNTRSAKDAVAAALMYYPENRDARKLQDQLDFWSEAGMYLVYALVGAIVLVVALQFRKRSQEAAAHDPYQD